MMLFRRENRNKSTVLPWSGARLLFVFWYHSLNLLDTPRRSV
jgi:hypothetical protein